MANLRIIKKYIGNDEVDGTKIKLNNAEQLKAQNAANNASVGLLKLTAADLLEFPQELRPQLSSYVVPVSDAELAPKKFVDDSVADEVSNRQVAMDNEISARSAADAEEVSARELAMANEISARTAADNTEVSARELAMANEISARTAADAEEVSARELAMANEISARTAADNTEVSARELAMANEISARLAASSEEVSARELAMANEISARTAADAEEVSARELAMANEISARTAADNTEVSARELAMANEISARLAASSEEVSARELAMANEISARAAADLALDGRLDTIEGTGDGSIKKAVADLAGTAPGLLETLGQLSTALVDGDVTTGLLNVLAYEVSARELAMDNEISARSAADAEEVSARELAMANEISARTAADNTEVSARELAMANEISARLAASSDEVSARELAMANEISARSAADAEEVSARELAMANEISTRAAADLALDGRLDSIEGSGGALVVGFTPAEVTDWDLGVDTVKEALDQVGADMTTAEGEIVGLRSDLEDEISNRQGALVDEISVRSAADLALSNRLDALETSDYSFVKESFTIDSAGQTSLTLAHLVSANSIVVFVGRLGLHQNVDFTLSVPDSVSVITWIDSMAVGGDEALAVGDKVFVTYAHI